VLYSPAMNHAQTIATQLKVKTTQVSAVIKLLDEGNTVPFIARYRKEMTAALDDEQVRNIADEIVRLRALDERRETILSSIREQGKITPELEAAIQDATTMVSLEDLYAPYRPKRRTRAMIARERGLTGLADLVLGRAFSNEKPESAANKFVGPAVANAEDALAGARDIVAEIVADDATIRSKVRSNALRFAWVLSKKIAKAEDAKAVFSSYYQFEQRVDRLLPHQVLALNRGEKEGVLKVSVELDERDWRDAFTSVFPVNQRSTWAPQLVLALDDAAERLVLPAIDRDVRRALSEKADAHAIGVFASNLKALLGAPPLTGRNVIGLDPGFRTGCKLAVVDATGKVLDTGVIYPHEPQKDTAGALNTLGKLVDRYQVSLISIGNGTASRESEELVAELIATRPETRYLIVSEAGASIYSASALARAELPTLDVTLRGAVSIARRAQDPLAELVKIDPKSIGVGLYQHDVDQTALGASLDVVVETLVNAVGVDVNTASPALLTHVSGLGPKLSTQIVAHRDENGPFLSRTDLKKVAGLGPKTFEQAAGFLRIHNGKNPLDESAIHPESYCYATALLEKAGLQKKPSPDLREQAIKKLTSSIALPVLAKDLGCGEPTLKDILEQLARPGRDPREEAPAPLLRTAAVSLDQLAPGVRVKGTVRNVVDFGAFVDIGVKQDGLLHRSRVPQGRVLSVGDIIDVEIVSIEADRGRISLGM